MEKIICSYCNKEFSKKGIYTHVERKHLGLNQKYSNGNNGLYTNKEFLKTLRAAADKNANKKYGIIEEHKFNCKKCNKEFNWTGRKNTKGHQIAKQKHCSQSCANSHPMTEERRENIRDGIDKAINDGRIKTGIGIKKSKNINCNICNTEFNKKERKSKFCSVICKDKYFEQRKQEFRKDLTEKQVYKKECRFNFNLKDFPDEFNFKLIEEHGWYSAKNRGNNLNGVSRDHMVSISYGFKNNIDSEIISHPANCQLLEHTKNSKKNAKCSITIEELYKRIEEWNVKYNKV